VILTIIFSLPIHSSIRYTKKATLQYQQAVDLALAHRLAHQSHLAMCRVLEGSNLSIDQNTYLSDGGVFSEGNAELLVYLVDEGKDIYIGVLDLAA
jgi:hypothetical protein